MSFTHNPFAVCISSLNPKTDCMMTMTKGLLYDGLGTVIDCMVAKRLLLLCENPKADSMMAKGLLLIA